MKFTCEKAELLEALQNVAHAISTRSTLAILSNVLLEVNNNKIKLVTTDLEIGLTCELSLSASSDGAVTVSQRVFQEVINSLPDGAVTVVADERNMLTVTSAAVSKAQFTIHGLPADEYPIPPQVVPLTQLTVPAADLRELVRKSLLGASKDETRAILTGCLLFWEGELVTMVATDTHRLAKKSIAMTGEYSAPVSVIIPSRALQELLKLIGNSEIEAKVLIGEKQVLFNIDNKQLVSRLLEGQFPAYDRVIPRDNPKHIVVNRQKLADAVRRASIVASVESNKLIFKTINGAILTIEAETGEIGTAYEEVPIEMIGEDIEIAFNAEYLQAVLLVLKTDTVDIALNGALNPGLITADGEDNYQYVVMPMQMN